MGYRHSEADVESNAELAAVDIQMSTEGNPLFENDECWTDAAGSGSEAFAL